MGRGWSGGMPAGRSEALQCCVARAAADWGRSRGGRTRACRTAFLTTPPAEHARVSPPLFSALALLAASTRSDLPPGSKERRQRVVLGLLRACRESETRYLVRTLVQVGGWRRPLRRLGGWPALGAGRRGAGLSVMGSHTASPKPPRLA